MRRKTSGLSVVVKFLPLMIVFLIFVGAPAASAQEKMLISPTENPEGQQIEYLEPVKWRLGAELGETVSQTIRVPIRITESDGKIHYGYETISLTLTNTIREFIGETGGQFPLMPIYYVRCSAVVNSGSRAYTSYVDWHYDGSYVWHDANGNLNHSASPPWYTNGTYEYANYPRGPFDSTMTYNIGYFKNPSASPSLDDAAHSVTWLLYKTGVCDASGTISLY